MLIATMTQMCGEKANAVHGLIEDYTVVENQNMVGARASFSNFLIILLTVG